MTRIEDDSRDGAQKLAWRSPRLEELGNLRDFVRVGHAFGKSVLTDDGNADAGGESMPQMG
jgi:hypothetical protein